MKWTSLRLLIVASGVVSMAWCQDQPDQQEGPGRGVARISLMNGDVSVRRGDSGEVVAAALNAPLVVEDQLLTGADSRAEVQFDYANMVRLAPMSEVRFPELENQRYQLQVARGMVTFRVLRDGNAQVEISTPTVSVRPVQQGSYRITVREDGTTEISVRSGEAEIFTPRGSERLSAGKTMLARGTASDPEFQVARAVAYDDWDRWNENRDRQLEGSRAYDHVSPDISGAEDLDSYGSWQNDASYGDVWYPRVADDWAPYRDGRWSWMDYYGWNWVSYDPWGWAPYHYGRWFHNDNRGWGWWPGDRYGRNYWSPGLVAFVGWDSWGGIGGGLGFGGIGWIPLAPHERYYPWYGNRQYAGYRNGGRYGNGLGLVNDFNFNSGYRNARVRNAITGVDGQGFASGRRGSAVQMGDSRLGRASLVRGALPVTPGRESLRLSDRAVGTGSLPRSRSNTSFVSRQQPARVDRVPFEDQRRGIDQMTRSTFSGQRSSAVNNSGPAGNRNATGIGATRQGSANAPAGNSAGAGNGGWRRFSEPAAGGGQNAVRGPQSQSGGSNLRTPQSSQSNPQGGGASRDSGAGWSRFGTGSGNSSPRAAAPSQNYRSNGGSVAPRSASPQYIRPGTSSPQVYRGGGQSQMRINPPIVRQRAPSYSGGGSNYNRPAPGGGGNYSRPAPSGGGGNYNRSAPSGGGSYSRSAPSGGGGNYSRSAPSSGGGSRNSGGGSRNSGRTR